MKLTLTLLLLVYMQYSFAQETKTLKTKQFYTEMGGPGILFSANFDTRFNKTKQTGLGMRVGLGFTIKDESYYDGTNYYDEVKTIGNLPIGLNYLLGKENSTNFFEIGAGATILFQKAAILTYDSDEDSKKGNLMGYFQFMYRKQPLHGGFSWRIGFTPVINTSGDIFPFGAVGLGYSF
jgi:hypothetical protein